MNFEIKLYLSNQVVFAYMTKKSQKKLKYLEDEKRWNKDEIKSIFHHF